MRRIGVVVGTCGDRVKVKVCRTTACEHCGRCSEEEKRARSVLEPPKEIIVEALNSAQATVGQTVELTAPDSSVILAAVWAYVVPLIAFITGAFFGHWLGPRIGVSDQAGSVLFGAVFLGGAYLFLRCKNKSLEQDRRFLSSVERVL